MEMRLFVNLVLQLMVVRFVVRLQWKYVLSVLRVGIGLIIFVKGVVLNLMEQMEFLSVRFVPELTVQTVVKSVKMGI